MTKNSSYRIITDSNIPSVSIIAKKFIRATINESGAYVKVPETGPRGMETLFSVSLPLPEQLQNNSVLDWSVEERSIMQQTATGLTESVNVSNTVAAVVGAGKQIISRSTDAIVGGNSVLQRSGLAADHLKEIFFNGVDNRTYQFDWLLAPKNSSESKTIKSIIAELEKVAHPSRNSTFLFNLPSSFEITFNGVEYPSIKDCVITNMSIDYNGSGNIRFNKDGTPSFVKLSISFTEIDIRTQEDF